jgi:hypothetical protein
MQHIAFKRKPYGAIRLAALTGAFVLSFVSWQARSDDAAATSTSASTPDISGVWQVTKYERAIRTVDGKRPPLKPEAVAVYERNVAARKTLKPKQDMSRCVPVGTPRIMWAPQPMMILQTPRKISFVHEYQHLLRHIYMDEPLPAAAEVDPSFMGDSVGRWEGDTLVVETIGVNTQTVLDREGMPHGAAMKVTERLRLIDGGKRLEDVVTIDDPETFTAPWTSRVVLERKKGVQLKEYNCVQLHEEF